MPALGVLLLASLPAASGEKKIAFEIYAKGYFVKNNAPLPGNPAYLILHDKKASLRYLEESRKRPDAPRYVSRWYYSTLASTGQASSEELLAFWIGIKDNAATPYEREAAPAQA